MPIRSKIPCQYPGCPNLVNAGEKYCKEHSKMKPKDNRSAFQRGYTKKWQKESKEYLMAHPFCEECRRHGILRTADVVDHIKPHHGDSKSFWDKDNWQSLCKSCHDKKTGCEDRVTYGYDNDFYAPRG